MSFRGLRMVVTAVVAVLVATVNIATGVSIKNLNDNQSEETQNTEVTSVIEPEVIYITEIETVTVTEVVTEVVTEIQYVEYYPDDYEMVHDYYYLSQEKYEANLAALAETYPAATEVWRMLTEKYGLTPYVAAGIIGNMMNECGGNTLKLQPTLYGGYKGYYGLCMWSAKYHPNVQGKSLEEQVDYLMSDIEYTFNTYGKLYKVGFDYEDFCSLKDVRAVSDAFMIVYERPGPTTKTTRRINSLYAYSVFVIQ